MTEKKTEMLSDYLFPYLMALSAPWPQMEKAFREEKKILKQICKGKRVADLGAGIGRPAYWLSKQCKSMTLFEKDPQTFKLLNDRMKFTNNVGMTDQDALHSNFEDSNFEVSLATYNFIGCVEDQDQLIKEMKRITIPDGLVFICSWNTSPKATKFLRLAASF